MRQESQAGVKLRPLNDHHGGGGGAGGVMIEQDMAGAQDTIYLCNFRVSVDGEWLCLKELQDVEFSMQDSMQRSPSPPLPLSGTDHHHDQHHHHRHETPSLCDALMSSSPPLPLFSSFLCLYYLHRNASVGIIKRFLYANGIICPPFGTMQLQSKSQIRNL